MTDKSDPHQMVHHRNPEISTIIDQLLTVAALLRAVDDNINKLLRSDAKTGVQVFKALCFLEAAPNEVADNIDLAIAAVKETP